MRMRVVDLFSGCGGLSLGFENAGFDVVAAYDNWQPAIAVHKANFTHPIFNVNLSDENIAVKHISEYQPNMIIGATALPRPSEQAYRSLPYGAESRTPPPFR